MKRFSERRACPVGGELRHQIVLSLAFSAPWVWDFLARRGGAALRPTATRLAGTMHCFARAGT